jgi:hypothetical protein
VIAENVKEACFLLVTVRCGSYQVAGLYLVAAVEIRLPRKVPMRRLLALSLVVVAAASGCRMCASPYDYCGPVVDDCCCGSDYQPQVPYQGTSAATMETTEPVYYEGNKPMPTKSARKPNYSTQQTSMQSPMPRQVKRPVQTNRYRS